MDTRWYQPLLAFIAGGLFINFLPHFINGISGRPFPSPFSDPPGVGLSSPVMNVVWALINLLVAAAFFHFGKLRRCSAPVLIGGLAGAVAMAFYLASYFGKLGL